MKSVVGFSTHWPQSAPFWPSERPQWFWLMSFYWPRWHKKPQKNTLLTRYFPKNSRIFPPFFLLCEESPYWVFFFLSSQEFLQTELCSTHTSQTPPQTLCRNTFKPPFSYISYTTLVVQSLFSLNKLVCLRKSRLRHSSGKDIHELKPSALWDLMCFIPHPAYTLNTLQIPTL